MTAEVAILNSDAVALAADSAATLSGAGSSKIVSSVSKIFPLSDMRPVGVMVYGGASLDSVPWESLFKQYRDCLGDAAFDALEAYCDDFLAFLRKRCDILFPEEAQSVYVEMVLDWLLSDVRDGIDSTVAAALESRSAVSAPEIAEIVDSVISAVNDRIMAGRPARDLPVGFAAEVRKRYGSVTGEAIARAMGAHSLNPGLRERLEELVVTYFAMIPDPDTGSPFLAGVVFAGFGEGEAFPRVREYHFDGVVGGHIRYCGAQSIDIDAAATQVALVPFAQKEMVSLFMEGVDPRYHEVMLQLISNLLGGYPDALLAGLPDLPAPMRNAIAERGDHAREAAMATLSEMLEGVRDKLYTDPVVSVLRLLPKQELAAVAEALVNLQSFKRRVSWDQETVGGPVDVAIISKADGFSWVKRKTARPG
jgi:hypothetical protein